MFQTWILWEEKWTRWGISRGREGTWSGYCCPITRTQSQWVGWDHILPVPMTACSWQQPEFVFPCLCSFSHLTKSQQLVLWRPRSWSKVLCELVDKQIKVKWYPARVVPGVLSVLPHTDLQVHLALGYWVEGATRTNAVWKVSVAQILLFLFVLRTRRKAIWGDWGVLLVFMCFPAPCNIRLRWQVPI